jgi:hypothetical protein
MSAGGDLVAEESQGAVPTDPGEGEHPRGTLFLTLLFLIALVAMWGYIFVQMIRAA